VKQNCFSSPGHIVLDGDLDPPQKVAQLPILGPCLLWPNGIMYQNTTCLSLGDIVLDGDPAQVKSSQV